MHCQGREELLDTIHANQKDVREKCAYKYKLLPKYHKVLTGLEGLRPQKMVTLEDVKDSVREEQLESGVMGNYTGAVDRLLTLAHNWVGIHCG